MTRDELEKRNVGENLDALMNLDPRGYGVCRILYAGSRAYTGEPLTMHAAQVLCDAVKENDLVYIITGFVLLPHKVPEMDGTVSSMLLARALVMAFGAKPVIVCPADSVQAIEKCAAVVGLHIYEDLDIVQTLPLSIGGRCLYQNPGRRPGPGCRAGCPQARGSRLCRSLRRERPGGLSQCRRAGRDRLAGPQRCAVGKAARRRCAEYCHR